jgi:Lon protease-like protein
MMCPLPLESKLLTAMNSSAELMTIPLFPLGSVLCPGGSLPLRIFEVRYLDMVGKCHKAGTPFGIVALTQGHEVRKPGQGPGGDGFAHEAFNAVGTLVEIVDFAAPQAGLLEIRCSGTQRFRMKSFEQLKHGLWTAQVEMMAPDLAVKIPADLQPAAQLLQNLIDTLQTRDVPHPEMPFEPPYHLDDCGWVANRWCEILPLPLQHKQRLMELDNPLLRLELINDLLDRGGKANSGSQPSAGA